MEFDIIRRFGQNKARTPSFIPKTFEFYNNINFQLIIANQVSISQSIGSNNSYTSINQFKCSTND